VPRISKLNFLRGAFGTVCQGIERAKGSIIAVKSVKINGPNTH